MYGRQLEFLRDTVTPKRTITSIEHSSTQSTEVQEERQEEKDEDDEEDDDVQESPSVSSSRASTPNVARTHVGKKRLHPVEEKILLSLDRYEKRAKMDKAKEKVEDNDNRHFLLSLVGSLVSLPRHLNTSCRLEIMHCINKYETMAQQHQQPLAYPPTTHSYGGHQQYTPQHQQHSQQQPHSFEPIHQTQMYVQRQLHSSLHTSNQVQSESQQYEPRRFVTPGPAPSPAESITSYISHFSDENDSQLNNC
ncbi:hypothetical protein PPYR_07558 [Photinus pyralis]|uniref:BESS domain-containing protein n=2 Tax=Photinus pyralis TaxID=7054 RepID=A0A1Y1KQV3_PHOPY|nr:hypothetical protein PPYR_07558 [Photinus pyralis]